jgi:hypothetical protein
MDEVMVDIPLEEEDDNPSSRLLVRGGLWLDSWLCAEGEPLKNVITSVLTSLADLERGERERARSARADAFFRETVEVVVSNLAFGVLNPRDGEGSSIALYLSKQERFKPTRYDNPQVTRSTLIKVAGLLERQGSLTLTKGEAVLSASTITPTERLIALIKQAGVSNSDFGSREGEEVIILNSSKAGRRHDREVAYDPSPTAQRLPYEDSPEIDACRNEVTALNRFLKDADIEFIDDGVEPFVNTRSRTLKRYFSQLGNDRVGAWCRNGRLYGGFWQNLKRARRANIRIGGEPTSLLDFSSMFVRLAYAHVGAEMPEDEDLYDLSGFLPGYDASQHRDGVKKGLNALLNGAQAGAKEIREALPAKTKPQVFREAVAARHPVLEGVLGLSLGKDIGMALMFTESQILLGCLNWLKDAGIVALPLHDGILVAQSRAEEAERAMKGASVERLGVFLPLKTKDPTG